MYHNSPDRIELHDDVLGVEKSKLDVREGEPVRLHMTYVLRPNRQYANPEEQDVRVHSTNGVQHRWYTVGEQDPSLVPPHAEEPVYPIVNGQNYEMFHNADGDPVVASPSLTNTNDAPYDAANSAAETRRFPGDITYHEENFDEEGKFDPEARLREQQLYVDETTAKKRRESGSTKDAPANSMTESERKEEKKVERKEEKKDK